MLIAPKKEYVRNIRLAYPIMIGSIGQVTVSLADSAMVGQLGAIPLAGISLANSLLAVPLVFGMGISYGITPLVANADGAQKAHLATRIFKNGLFINAIMGVLITLFLMCLGQFMHLFGQQPEVVEAAYPYYMVTATSFIPLLIFFSYKQFAEGLSDTKAAMRLSLIANALNVLLNWVFIYGHWGFEAMGMIGAAYATLISRTLMTIGLILWVQRHRKFGSFIQHFKSEKLSRQYVKKVLSIGIPSGLQHIFEVGAFAAAALLAGMIGVMEQAAHQISITLASVSYMAAAGFGATATIRIGNQLGKRDYPVLRTAATTLFQMTIVFMLIAGIIFLLGRDYLPQFFNDNPEVIAIASQLLIIVTLFQISDGVQVTALGALRGLSDVRMPTFITFSAYWLLALPLAYYLGIHTSVGIYGIWLALAIGLTASATFLWLRFRHKSRALGDK